MTESEKLKSKRGSLKRIRLGCAVLIGIAILIPVLCYGSMWLFARYGGEWATASDIPIPENGQFVAASYSEGYLYISKHSLYIYPITPEELRERFIQLGVRLTPIGLDLEGERFIEYDDAYGTVWGFYRSTNLHDLHRFSALLTAGWFDESISMCQGVRVYKDIHTLQLRFPEVNLPDSYAGVIVTTCWPKVH